MNDIIVGEWKPLETFNILDVRDFQNFPYYETPPYVLRFNFTNIPVEFSGIVMDVMGWNIPECHTDVLFSRIQVSKNGFQDVYYSQPSLLNNHLVLQFNHKMKIHTPQDVMVISLFPMCPIHMVTLERIGFLSSSSSKTIVDNKKEQEETTKKSQPPTPLLEEDPTLLKPTTFFSHYWYLYTTVLIMILLFMMTLLFMVMNSSSVKKRYIVLRRPQK
jgi:hypothetical protein